MRSNEIPTNNNHRRCIVDAVHIYQFAKSRNDDPKNGMAVSKNAHWLFDQGLWTISDTFTVVVAEEHFSESSPNGRALNEFHGEEILLPRDKRLWPDLTHIRWHRKNNFWDNHFAMQIEFSTCFCKLSSAS